MVRACLLVPETVPLVVLRKQTMDGWMDFTIHGTGQGAWDCERVLRGVRPPKGGEALATRRIFEYWHGGGEALATRRMLDYWHGR